MRIERWNIGGWLAIGILLFPSCSTSFQNPNPVYRSYNQNHASNLHPLTTRTAAAPLSMGLNVGNILTKLPGRRRKLGSSIQPSDIRGNGRGSLGISKYYTENLERKSGKDYRWIKSLTKPLSHPMRYVRRQYNRRLLHVQVILC